MVKNTVSAVLQAYVVIDLEQRQEFAMMASLKFKTLLCFFPFMLFPDYTFSAGKAIWFAPESHYPPGPNSDFVEAFNHPESWANAARHINVLLISTQTFVAAPDDFIRKIIQFTKINKISLGVTAEFQCGKVPGTPQLAQLVAKKIATSGGDIQYIVMDEPLFWVHFTPRSSGCQLSLDETVAKTAAIVNAFLSQNPTAIVGDIEPFPALAMWPGWKQSFDYWNSKLEAQIMRKMAFLHLDFDWRTPQLTIGNDEQEDPSSIHALLVQLKQFADARDIPLGMIIDGKPTARSDKNWFSEAQYNSDIVASSGVSFQHIIYASWHQYPEKILPDSNPNTFSGFILRSSQAP